MRFFNIKPGLFVVIATSFIFLAASTKADEISIRPRSIQFRSLNAIETLQLLQTDTRGVMTEDFTSQAQWEVKPAELAQIENGSVLTPLMTGQGKIIARLKDNQEFSIPITIQAKPELENTWTFENHVQAVLTKTGCNSGPCHGSAAGKNGFRLSLRGYAPEMDYDALTRQANGRRLSPGHPEQSLILWKATGAVPHGGGSRIAPETRDYKIIAEWINGGAIGLNAKTPRITKLEVSPGQARLKSGKSGQVVVHAVFSDKSREDVTAWSKFNTTDETVLTVDDSGRFTTVNPGEAYVTVWFSSMVATVTISVPSEIQIPESVFLKAARNNKIDEFNLLKLQSLGIPPSPDAGDSEWLRRIYLDLTGQLPELSTVKAFLNQNSPDKRQIVINQLLASDAFVDYWAYQWSDLLLVSSQKLPTPAMWSFYNFVRDSVARNQPWDEFVREIVTSRGGTLKNGSGNYYVLHRDPTDLTETTSVAFLGLSLTCARCHNHPLEKWTQDQYYGFASLLSRVGLKDGSENGSVIVSDRPTGEIMHPRKGRPMPAQPLDSVAIEDGSEENRREVLAQWMTSPDNPLFAKAVMNRVWKKLTGRGMMEPEDDLRATNPAMDEAMLAWLESDFISHKFDIRHLIRTIVQSSLYARSSIPLAANVNDTRFFSHAMPRRLPAEVLLDIYSQTTGVPTSFPGFPEKWRAMQLPDSKVANGFLSAFGRPERIATCSCERSNEPSVAQALHLTNGDTLNNKLKSDQGQAKIYADSGDKDSELILDLFLTTLTREPSRQELQSLENVLMDARNSSNDPEISKRLRREAWEDIFWAILTSEEFLFNH